MATSGHNTFQQATPNKLQCFPRAANRTRNASSPAFHPAIPLQCQLNPQNVLAAQSLIGNRAVVQLLRQQQGRDTQTTNNTHLPEPLKTNMESLSGIDLSEVQVHYHSEKPAKLNALAYAQGSNIYLEAGQEQHLPHEAWHVVQQKQGRVKPTLQMKNGISVNDNPALEKEADTIGASAMGREQGGVSLIPLQMKQTSKNQVIQFVENNDPRKVNLFGYLDSFNKERNKKVGKSIKFRSGSIVEIGMISPSQWKEISAAQNIPEYVEHKIVDKINDSQRKINTIRIDPSMENGSQILERILAELKSLAKELAEPIYANHLASISSILKYIDKLTPLYTYMHSRHLAEIDNALDKYDELAGDNINFFLEALKSEIKEELERDPNKKGLNVEIVFLDKGNEKAGLKHILTAHQEDFEKIGIKKDDIASIVMEAVTKGKIVNAQGSSERDRGSRPIFQVTYKGKEYKIAVTIANNGYIVGANPAGK